MKTLRIKCNADGVNIAEDAIRKGGIVIFPTDTVYGIGCDPYDVKAIEKIYEIKKRNPDKLFPILGFSKNILSKIVLFDKKSNKVAEKFWPGPITLVLPLKDEKLKKLMNLENKIAVRVPNNQCTLALLERCDLLIGTSANISDSGSITDPDECAKRITGYDVLLDGGKIAANFESTIIEIKENEIQIHREGSVSREEVLSLF